MRLQTPIRLLAEAVVLFFVWRNVHWTAAIVLTILTVQGEMLCAVVNDHYRKIEKIEKKLKRLQGE